MQLDKSKPYATIFGEADGRVYEQGGHHFNGDGSLWVEPSVDANPELAPVSKKSQAKRDAKPAAPLQAIKAASIAAEDQQILDQMKD